MAARELSEKRWKAVSGIGYRELIADIIDGITAWKLGIKFGTVKGVCMRLMTLGVKFQNGE